ncbi:MAG TPA: DUF418 domain-containing protein [Steroidobacteraceae bacterium]|jgi:uncharacterized protein
MTTALAPTERQERIGMLDTTRGIAVLGILIMNITGFGLPRAYDDPTNWGGSEGLNLTVWRIAALLFEGTMRGMFTLLFGAGALLFLQRHAARNPGLLPADLFFRRTMWLIVFGLINAYVLVWSGDILYYYGVVGLLLFVFRNVAPRKLIAAAAVIMALQTAVTINEWYHYHETSVAAAEAQAARSTGKVLTEAQTEAIESFAKTNEQFKPSREELDGSIERMRKSYASALGEVAPESWHFETVFFFQHGLLECLGMMLLGMALLKLGVLSGAASPRVYATLLFVGYAIGLAVNLFETTNLVRDDFSPEALITSYLTYDLGRIPMTLGHVGLIGLIYRAPALSGAMRALAATGQMALTNYLSQSLICLFLFTGAGFALFGQLQRYELYYVVVAIWIVQLIWSSLWLRRFRFGPAEWVWRSLTYWKKQPMRNEVTQATQVTQVT